MPCKVTVESFMCNLCLFVLLCSIAVAVTNDWVTLKRPRPFAEPLEISGVLPTII
jgi:hypothetical protein